MSRPEVNADNTITFRLPYPVPRRSVCIPTCPSLAILNEWSAGFDMTKDANGVWSFTTPKLAPSYYQYWFEVDGSTPSPIRRRDPLFVLRRESTRVSSRCRGRKRTS